MMSFLGSNILKIRTLGAGGKAQRLKVLAFVKLASQGSIDSLATLIKLDRHLFVVPRDPDMHTHMYK